MTVPSSVGTSTDSTANFTPHQRKSFYANGRFWVFWSDGSNMVYATSTDGSSWTNKATVRACAYGGYFSIWFDGTYLHYAYANNSQISYRRGTPISDGSITWSADEQTVSTTYNSAVGPVVSVDSNGYVWIGYKDYDSGNNKHYPYVIKSGNNDGTWGTTPSGFPYKLSATSSSSWRASPIPLTGGKMLAIYAYSYAPLKVMRWTGSGWGSERTGTSNAYYGYYISAVAEGDDVHIVFLKSSGYDILYVKYTYSADSLGGEVTVQAGATSTSVPVLSRDPSSSTLYVFYATKTTGTPPNHTANHIYYKTSTDGGSSWSSPTDWIDETSEVLTNAERLTCYSSKFDSKIGLVHLSKTSSAYNVRFEYLTLVTPSAGGGVLAQVM